MWYNISDRVILLSLMALLVGLLACICGMIWEHSAEESRRDVMYGCISGKASAARTRI